MVYYYVGHSVIDVPAFWEPEAESCLWNDQTIPTVKLDGQWFALYGWNGESYGQCWELADPQGYDQIDPDTEYNIFPVRQQTAPDEFEIVGYMFD